MAATTAKEPVIKALKWYAGLTLISIGLILALPIDRADARYYHLSALAYKGTLIGLDIPIWLVWFIAFWGYAKLKQYSLKISQSPEGPYFKRLTLGVAWLAWSLPVSSIISRILGAIGYSHPKLHSATVILNNYVNLGLALIAFIIIASAARHFVDKAILNMQFSGARLIMALVAILGASYCFVIFKGLDLSSLVSTNNPYYLPAWLLLVSIIIPYLYAWLVGLLAAYEIAALAHRTRGIIYKRALVYLVVGLVAIILSDVAVQYLSTVWAVPGHLKFDTHHTIITLVRVVGGLGFGLLSIGATKLKKIEDV